MKPKMQLATLILLGAVPLVGFSASPDYGTSSSQSGAMGSSGSTRDQSSTSGMSSSDSDMSVPKQFQKLDKNKDGMISKDEAKRSKDMSAHFDDYDTDHDGRISVSEWKAHATSGAAGVSGSTRSGGATGGMTTPEVSSPSGADKGGGSSGGMGGSSSGGSMGGSSGRNQ